MNFFLKTVTFVESTCLYRIRIYFLKTLEFDLIFFADHSEFVNMNVSIEKTIFYFFNKK